MPDCEHQNLTLQVEASSRTVDIYQCPDCGATAYRRWTRSKGRGPLTFHRTQGAVEKRMAWEKRMELNRIEQMRHRDQETDLQDL